MTERHPPFQALRVHLEEQQQVVFDKGSEIESLETQRDTELTAFFTNNEKHMQDPEVDVQSLPKYVDMPKMYTYNKSNKQWV